MFNIISNIINGLNSISSYITNTSRIYTTCLSTTYVSVTTSRCQSGWGMGPQVDKFQQVSNDDH